MKHSWLYISSHDLKTERQQLVDEGSDISVSAVEGEFSRLSELDLDNDLSLQAQVHRLYDRIASLLVRAQYRYNELQ